MAELKVIILAAGKSKRMKSDLPKVLHPVAGRPMLQHELDLVSKLDPVEIICIVGHQQDLVRDAFKHYPKVVFVEQREQLGTAHAAAQAKDRLKDFKGDVLIINGDLPLIRPATLERFYTHFRATKAPASLLTATLMDPTGWGRIIRDGSGRLRHIVEEKDCLPEFKTIKEVNVGFYLFRASELMPTLDQIGTGNAQNEYYLTDAVQALFLQDKIVETMRVDDAQEVVGVNTRRELAIADAIMRGWIMIDLLENGVTLIDPATTYIEADVKIGRDTTIYPFSCIRAGVKIGERCEIGPFVHLRAGSVLDNDTKGGAFVEMKNAHLFPGAKAGHMAYLGDVDIGKDANIGAGTIVANYDGKKKHKTIIEDEAFIGCGTVLVAPVRIGRGAATGANTVVPKNKDVPPGVTVVGAPARELAKAKR
ncbi:MAG: NTP transferase domain-containing protein [Planctomycetes bacterium]|nr:NTP transferase domain-containing protein [Planctomycetota bacterium]NUQ34226.1 bifunctional N-acetylglucosamine-1-phosphate uridyltransferase/glucosamine-1-phosphate acetyltransferase [Planctomycetaceae bacterium]